MGIDIGEDGAAVPGIGALQLRELRQRREKLAGSVEDIVLLGGDEMGVALGQVADLGGARATKLVFIVDLDHQGRQDGDADEQQ